MKLSYTHLKSVGAIVVSITSLFCLSTSAYAEKIAYANNAGSAGIYKVDLDTGNILQTYTNSNGLGGNGRGVVVVGNTIYSTVVNDSKIYKTDATTGASLGFIQTSVASMSTIGWDGANFWTTDYAGTNRGFQIDISGNTIKTLNFSASTSYMDGMEYFNGMLIVNNTDGGYGGPMYYSTYDLDGNLLVKNFITSVNGTGIAFDGTNFLVSDVYNTSGKSINVYSGTTGAFINSIHVNGSWLVEDLSVDYAQREDTGGDKVPEAGSTLALLGLALTSLAAFGRRIHV